MKTFTIEKKPAKDDGEGDERFGKAHRQYLATVFDNDVEVDSAYFQTKAEAEAWVRDFYKLL